MKTRSKVFADSFQMRTVRRKRSPCPGNLCRTFRFNVRFRAVRLVKDLDARTVKVALRYWHAETRNESKPAVIPRRSHGESRGMVSFTAIKIPTGILTYRFNPEFAHEFQACEVIIGSPDRLTSRRLVAPTGRSPVRIVCNGSTRPRYQLPQEIEPTTRRHCIENTA